MAKKIKTVAGTDGYEYPITSYELVVDENGESVKTKLEDIENEIGTETLNTTSQNLKGAINEVFQSVSNGKTLIANAITDKGVNTLATDTFQVMANNIRKIVTETTVNYTITNNLTYCSNDNTGSSIVEGSTYTANITPNSGYELSSVIISMGGADITSSVYSNGQINITSVTGDIAITAIATVIVIPSTEPVLTYTFNNEIAGNGYGTISLSVPSSDYEGTYTIKYADDTGELSNYADICTLSPTVNSQANYTYFNKDQLIPKYATKIIAVKDDATKVEFAIPTNKRFTNGNYGEHLYSFGAISDIHLSIETAESDFASALTYLNNNENVVFTCISGDCTDGGTEAQLTTYKSLVDTNSANTPVYATNGNHELYNSSFTDDLWNTYVTNTKDYVFTHDNDVFIFLGLTTRYGANCYSTSQRTWLEGLLSKYSTARVFLFTHPFINGTGNGNYNSIYTNIILATTNNPSGQWLFNLMKQYKNVMLFTGHSHLKFITQELSSTITVCNEVDGTETGYMLHIPSITAPREITSGSAISEYLTAQSEGVVIDVYENCILYRGRNFVDEKFIPIGQFILQKTEGSITLENYTITNNLTNCTSNNTATSIIEGNSYTSVLTANSNYELSTVTVTMGDTDITSSVYSNGNISISSVTGNIVITATAVSTSKPCTSISLSSTTLTLNDDTLTSTLTATVSPSDTTDTVTWITDNSSVATVSNGVVTAVANGSCTITATCGTQSATCNVTVSMSILTTAWEYGTINSSTGVDEALSGNLRTAGFIPVSSSNTYLLTLVAPVASSSSDEIKSVAIYCYDSNKNYISRCPGKHFITGASNTYFLPACTDKDITSNIFSVSGVAYIRIRFSSHTGVRITDDYKSRVVLKVQ